MTGLQGAQTSFPLAKLAGKALKHPELISHEEIRSLAGSALTQYERACQLQTKLSELESEFVALSREKIKPGPVEGQPKGTKKIKEPRELSPTGLEDRSIDSKMSPSNTPKQNRSLISGFNPTSPDDDKGIQARSKPEHERRTAARPTIIRKKAPKKK